VEAFFASGRAVDVVLVVMIAQTLVLLLRRRADPLSILLAVLPGVLILVALRMALTGATWPAIALPLLASWPLHLADLKRRRW
jgi:hypothetical protein